MKKYSKLCQKVWLQGKRAKRGSIKIVRTFPSIQIESESPGMKNMKEELIALKEINELLQNKLDKLETQLAEVNEVRITSKPLLICQEILAVTSKLNELRSGESGKELTKALESVETIIIVQDSINNVIKKISEDKEKVNERLGTMKSEFTTLGSQLSNEKREKSKLEVTVQDLEARLTDLMKKMEKVNFL
jgi:chromosome segregation ATPase